MNAVNQLFGFAELPETEQQLFTDFTPANAEYFRRQVLQCKFLAGSIEPNYDQPYQQMIEIARHHAAADVYLALYELATSKTTKE